MNKFKITIDGIITTSPVNLTDHHKANVEVNGISYDVSYESKNTVAAPIRKSTAPGTPQVHVSAPAAAASSATSIKLASRNDHDHQRKSRWSVEREGYLSRHGSHENGKHIMANKDRTGESHPCHCRTDGRTGR